MDRHKLKQIMGKVKKDLLGWLFFKSGEGSKYSQTLRTIAAVVLVTFVVTSMHDYVYATAPVNNPGVFTLAPSIGKITETYKGEGENKIFLIQDVHCNAGVQENISKIIDSIQKEYGKDFKVVGVEGTPTQKIDTSALSIIPDKDIRENIVRYFVDRGYITGAEWYAIMNPNKVELRGLEDDELYIQNFTSLYNSLWYRYDIGDMFAQVQKGYDRGKGYLYTQEMKALESKIKEYDQRIIGLEEFILYMKDKTKEYEINFDYEYKNLANLLTSYKIKKRIKPDLVAAETNYVIQRLGNVLNAKELAVLKEKSRTESEEYYLYLKNFLKEKNIDVSKNYQNLAEYFNYLDHMISIDDIQLLEEKEDLEYRLKSKMIRKRRDARELLYSEHYLDIFEKFLWNKASAKDVEEWNREKDNYDRVEKFSGRLLRVNYLEEKKSIIELARNNMQNFYRDADKRNEILTKNLLDPKVKKGKITAMVLGGYHAEGIKNFLKSKGVSYEMVTPAVEKLDGEDLYINRLEEQADWLIEKKGEKIAKNFVSERPRRSALQLYSLFYSDQARFNKGFKELEDLVKKYKDEPVEELTQAIDELYAKWKKEEQKKKEKIIEKEKVEEKPEEKIVERKKEEVIAKKPEVKEVGARAPPRKLRQAEIEEAKKLLGKEPTKDEIQKSNYLKYAEDQGVSLKGYGLLQKFFGKDGFKKRLDSKGEKITPKAYQEQQAQKFRSSKEYQYLRYTKFKALEAKREQIKKRTKTVQKIIGDDPLSGIEALVVADIIFDIMLEDKEWHLRGSQLAVIALFLQGYAPEAGTAAGKTAAITMANAALKLMMGKNYSAVISVEKAQAINKFLDEKADIPCPNLLKTVGVELYKLPKKLEQMKKEALYELEKVFLNSKKLPIATHGEFGHFLNREELRQAVDQKKFQFIDESHKVTSQNLSFVQSGEREVKASIADARYVFGKVIKNLYKEKGEGKEYTLVETDAKFNEIAAQIKYENKLKKIAKGVAIAAVLMQKIKTSQDIP
ncbi:hypothetical protein ACFL5N_00980 [bacterium]